MFFLRILTFIIAFTCCSCFWYKPVVPNSINLRLNENPLTFDPHLTVDVTGGEVLTKIHAGLLRFNQDYEIVPDLAESYSISESGLIYSFILRENCHFADGSSLTSLHVKESFERLLNKKTLSPRCWVLNRIMGSDKFYSGSINQLAGIKIIDERRFEITLKEKFSPFAALLTMPQASVFKFGEGRDEKSIIGAGPYYMGLYKFDRYLDLLPNEYYQSEYPRSPVSYKIIPEDSSAIAMQATEDLDIIKLPRQQASLLKEQINISEIMQIEELNTYYLGFDLRKKYLTVPLREAVAKAVNKKAIIEMVLGGQAVEAVTPVPPVLLNNMDCKKLKIPFQLSEARDIVENESLAERELVFLVSAGRESVAAASVIQDNLKEAGIKLRLQIIEWSAYKQAIEAGEADLFLLSWWADYADAENFLAPVFLSANIGPAGNRVHYNSLLADSLIRDISQAVSTEEKIKATYSLLELLKNDLPWVPLWHRVTSYAVSKKIKGFYPPPMYSMSKSIALRKDKGAC